MKKLFSYLILCFLISFSSAVACDFKKIKYGEKTQELKINILAPTFKDNFGGEKYAVPIEELCPNNSELFGTTVNYLFIDNELSQIFLERFSMNDTGLLDFAEKKYGQFLSLTSNQKSQWRGSKYWIKEKETVNLIVTNIQGGEKIEILEFTPFEYEEKITKYAESVGKWLDEQQ